MSSTSLHASNACTTGQGFDPCDRSADIQSFMSSDLWAMARRIMFVMGAFVVIAGAVRFISKLSSGKLGDGVKSAVATVFGAAFLFNPHWLFQMIDLGAEILGGMFETVSTGEPNGTISGPAPDATVAPVAPVAPVEPTVAVPAAPGT